MGKAPKCFIHTLGLLKRENLYEKGVYMKLTMCEARDYLIPFSLQ